MFKDEVDMWANFGANIGQFGVVIFGYIILVIVNQRAGRDFLNQTERLVSSDKQFRIIFDNCQEPVVILSQDKAIYANNSFLL